MVYGADVKIIPAWTIALIVLARMSKDQGLNFLIGAVNHTHYGKSIWPKFFREVEIV